MANKKGIWAAFSTVFEKLGSKIGEFRQFFAQIHHYLPKSGEFSRPKTLVLSPKSANIFFMEELTPIKWYKQKWVWVLKGLRGGPYLTSEGKCGIILKTGYRF